MARVPLKSNSGNRSMFQITNCELFSTIVDVKGDGNVCHSLNVDGAFDASDSDENDGEPKGQNLGKTSATGNGNDNFEGVYIKEEEMEGNEEDWTDPMDHVEVITTFCSWKLS